MNVFVFDPEATVTEAGTVAAPVLPLDRATTFPPVGAFALSVTVPVEAVPPVTLVRLSETDERSWDAAGRAKRAPATSSERMPDTIWTALKTRSSSERRKNLDYNRDPYAATAACAATRLVCDLPSMLDGGAWEGQDKHHHLEKLVGSHHTNLAAPRPSAMKFVTASLSPSRPARLSSVLRVPNNPDPSRPVLVRSDHFLTGLL